MKAMILAAGRGERMRPLTDHTPKPLLKVGGKPLIVWHIENLAKAGFKEIVINHAHLGAQIEATLGSGSVWGVNIEYSAETVALETAGGIANALHLLTENGMKEEPFIVVNGDTFTDFNFSNLSNIANLTHLPFKLERSNESETMQLTAHLVLINNPPQHPAGDFAIQNGMLKNTGEPMFTFSGIGLYHPRLFSAIKPGQPAKLAPLLREAINQNRAGAEYFSGVWHDIGTPERLSALNIELLK